MRIRRRRKGVSVQAIAGSHVVLLGLDLQKARRKGCLGFALQREDHTEDERYWMSGMKTFAETGGDVGPGGTVSSREHPFQTFQWSDFSAKPDHRYTYRVVPLYGKPTALQEGDAVEAEVTTESEHGDRHSVFFNRGSVATQEYARRFQNRRPDELPDPTAARRWLSRGLHEAIVAFIGRAKGARYAIHAAIYEFQWPEVLAALRVASKTGANVHVVYDGIADSTSKANRKAILAAKIASVCRPRTVGSIMHNKFFVLSKDGEPVAVLTGSTNITENGIFGHSNCAHVVEDATVARAYLEYWSELRRDESPADTRSWVGSHNPAPPPKWPAGTTPIFSPHSGLAVLDGYAALAATAKSGLFMTFPFGMHKSFLEVYGKKDGILRFALMDKAGVNADGAAAVQKVRRLPNVVVAIGNRIVTNAFDRWLKELDAVTSHVHVHWVHTKYMLVDPLGPDPVVVIGSANFSQASTSSNDENMLVIRGEPRVADIYLGEFMRLHSHYAFREAVAIHKESEDEGEWHPSALVPDDSWQAEYFRAGSPRDIRRRYFA